MTRIILIALIVGFILWLLFPLLKSRKNKDETSSLDQILQPKTNSFLGKNLLLIIILAGIFFVVVFWFLPKLGVNIVGLLPKILPLISSLRGILPF